jgi:hypothetical protein
MFLSGTAIRPPVGLSMVVAGGRCNQEEHDRRHQAIDWPGLVTAIQAERGVAYGAASYRSFLIDLVSQKTAYLSAYRHWFSVKSRYEQSLVEK